MVTGNLILQCGTCHTAHTIPSKDTDFDLVSQEERDMGTESTYYWTHNIDCTCGSDIEIEYYAYEYPPTALNDDDVRITAGKLIQKFGYDFHGEPDPNDF